MKWNEVWRVNDVNTQTRNHEWEATRWNQIFTTSLHSQRFALINFQLNSACASWSSANKDVIVEWGKTKRRDRDRARRKKIKGKILRGKWLMNIFCDIKYNSWMREHANMENHETKKWNTFRLAMSSSLLVAIVSASSLICVVSNSSALARRDNRTVPQHIRGTEHSEHTHTHVIDARSTFTRWPTYRLSEKNSSLQRQRADRKQESVKFVWLRRLFVRLLSIGYQFDTVWFVFGASTTARKHCI